MNKFNFKEDLLPHFIALAVLFTILSVFFFPVYSGKSLVQGDIVQHKGASKSISDHREKYGEEPLWSNSVFGGSPSYFNSTLHYGQIFIDTYKSVTIKLLPKHINLLYIGMLCFYILMITVGMNPIIATIAAIAFTFSTYNLVTLEAGHNSKILTLAFSPLVLAGIYQVFTKKYVKGLLLTTIAVTLFLSAKHYQIMYYLIFGIAITSLYFIVDLIKKKDFTSMGKMIGVFSIVILLSLGNNFADLFSNIDYVKNHSTRGKKDLIDNKQGSKKDAAMDYDYAFSWSYGILESATWVIPYYYGGSSHENLGKKSKTYEALKKNNVPARQAKNFVSGLPTYWGDQPFTSGPTYFGAVVMMLFIVTFFIWDNKIKWYLLCSILFTWILSLGDNISSINYFLFDNLPGMNKFRAVAMASSITQIFVVLTAMIGLSQLMKEEILKDTTKLYKGIGVAIGSTILLALIGMSQDFVGASDAQLQSQPSWILDAIHDERASLLKSDSFRSILFMILAALAIFMLKIKKLDHQKFTLIIGILVLVDLWGVSKRYINEDNFSKTKSKDKIFKTSIADNSILEDKTNYRVFNVASNTFNENGTSYFHQNIGGYLAAKMQRYQDIIERRLTPEKGMLVNAFKQTQDPRAFKAQVFPKLTTLNMLNAKYIIYNPGAKPLINESALGNAWFINTIIETKNPNEEIDKLNSFDPTKEAIIDNSRYKTSKNSYNGTGNIKLVEWKNNYLKYEYESNENGFIVFSENFYADGWSSTIDNEDKEHIRVNYILRGMEVPKGKHTIEFNFKPETYQAYNNISMGSSILSFLLIGVCIFLIFKSDSQNKSTEE